MTVTALRQAATSILIQHRMMRCLRIVRPPGSSAPHTQKGLRSSFCLTDKPPLTAYRPTIGELASPLVVLRGFPL